MSDIADILEELVRQYAEDLGFEVDEESLAATVLWLREPISKEGDAGDGGSGHRA